MRLARLLDEPERKMRRITARLEDMSGYNSEDVRLLEEVNSLVREKTSDLGLDPADTTGEELYEALKAKLSRDMVHLNRAWGLGGQHDLFQIIKLLEHLNPADKLLAIRCSSVKKMLAIQKPKKTIKLLGYRSLDSMLKHEDTALVLAVALASESQQWRAQMSKWISGLRSSDYEIRKIKFVPARAMPADITAVPLMAAVCISAKASGAQSVIRGVAVLAELVDENMFLTGRQFNKNFNKIAERVFSGHYDEYLSIDGHEFVNQKNLLRLSDNYGSSRNVLARAHPLLAWWTEAAHIALDAGRPVSMNLYDCLENLIADIDFQSRRAENFAAELKHRLLARYNAYDGVKEYLQPPVDDTFISIDGLGSVESVPEFEEILT